MLFAGGCGDESDDSSDASASASSAPATSGGSSGSSGGTGGSGSTSSLSITGSPPSQIMQGQEFSYTPTVSNPGSVSLSFSATNLPSWASIDPTTGRIWGTPGAGDVGVYSNIRVTVTGGGTSATSPAWSVSVVSVANGQATLTWLAPTENTDGSPLTVAGYKIYWGQSPSNMSNSVQLGAGTTTFIVEQLTPATWYFAATALDGSGTESDFSNVASKTIM